MQSRDNFDCVIVDCFPKCITWQFQLRFLLNSFNCFNQFSTATVMPEKSNEATVELWFLTPVQYSHYQQRDCRTNSTLCLNASASTFTITMANPLQNQLCYCWIVFNCFHQNSTIIIIRNIHWQIQLSYCYIVFDCFCQWNKVTTKKGIPRQIQLRYCWIVFYCFHQCRTVATAKTIS